MEQNVICWFEIYADDIERAKKFYHDVLGTEFTDAPAMENSDDYKMSFFSSPENRGVSGALVQSAHFRSGPVQSASTIVYFPCDDCSVEESRVEQAGGQVIQSKMSLGEFGFCSICLDSEQNTFGLHSMQ